MHYIFLLIYLKNTISVCVNNSIRILPLSNKYILSYHNSFKNLFLNHTYNCIVYHTFVFKSVLQNENICNRSFLTTFLMDSPYR